MQAKIPQTEAEQLHWLSFFALNGTAVAEQLREAVESIPADAIASLLALADLHHVAIRTIGSATAFNELLDKEISPRTHRNAQTVATASRICEELEKQGCLTMAIKSTDHWPDLGSDFDLFTTGDADVVHGVMKRSFDVEALPQNWADRLASKWNFRIPGLNPLIEIHVGRMGQTGELTAYGKELVARRRQHAFGEVILQIPAVEDQIILSTLQRLYRHFFYRICDFTDTLEAITEGVDFEQLRLIAKRQGIWQGVATHLRLVNEYCGHYRGEHLVFPAFVRKSARFGIERLSPNASYFRLPLFPQGATLWSTQVIKTWNRRNHAGVLRLGLLPPLAAAAGATYKITGKQRIW
jgi:hypothetical protein